MGEEVKGSSTSSRGGSCKPDVHLFFHFYEVSPLNMHLIMGEGANS